MKPTNELIEVAAAAIANARGGRRGMPPIENVLEMLAGAAPTLHAEVMEDAEAALAAVSLGDLWAALVESLKLQSHYAELLNMHDGGARLQFRTPAEWIARLREVKKITTEGANDETDNR